MSILLTIWPIFVCTIDALIDGSLGGMRRSFLTVTMVVALFLVIFNIVKKYNLRTPLLLVITGLSFCFFNMTVMLLFVCLGTALDEFLFTPLAIKYKRKMSEHQSIDERLNDTQ